MKDVRFAFRMWARTPAFSIAALTTLALGLGAATALFSVCDRILFRSLPYPDADHLVSVGLMAPLDTSEFLLGHDYLQLWRDPPAPFEAATTVTAGTSACDLTEERPQRLTCAYVEPNLLRVLALSPAAGRDFTVDDGMQGAARVALITSDLWRRRFAADPRVVGRMLNLDGTAVQIAGVLPAGFELPTLASADILIPQQLSPTQRTQFLRGFARLKPGVTAAQASVALQPLFREMLKNVPPAFRGEVTLRVRSLRDRQLGDSRSAAWFLLGAVAALLLIACSNVANLLLARSAARRRELAIRAALGASRVRLARLAFTESASLALIGGALGLALAWVLLRALIYFAPQGLIKLDQASLDTRAVLASIGLTLVSALFTGLWPALAVPRAEALHSARTVTSIRRSTRFGFVAIQIALTFTLLGTSTLLMRSLWAMQQVSLGFETQNVLSASVTLNAARYAAPERQVAFFEELLERSRAMPGTISVAITDSLPPSGSMRSMIFAAIEVAGRPMLKQGTGGMVAWRLVTPGYFEALRIPIVRGRGFTPDDRNADKPALVLSESMERKLFPNENAIGKRVRTGMGESPWYTVVGIARDTRNAGLTIASDPEYYVSRGVTARDATRRSFLVLRTQLNTATAAAYVRETVASLDRELPVSVSTLEEHVSSLSARPRFMAFLLAGFGVLATILAAIGLGGVVGYLVTERTRDIGVRIALGATPGVIRRAILVEATRWVAAGAVLGAFFAAASNKLVGSLLFGIKQHDPWSWAAAIGVLGLVSLFAALLPAMRAARIDPMTALRAE